jgi:hypothetical protein
MPYLAKGLKPGDRFQLRVPALGDRLITAAIKVIATKGEYAGWRARHWTRIIDLLTVAMLGRRIAIAVIQDLRRGNGLVGSCIYLARPFLFSRCLCMLGESTGERRIWRERLRLRN